MGKNCDLAGRRFGKLTAVEPTQERKNGYTVWRCACDCGGEALASSRALKNGWAKDCGCMPPVKKYQDLAGRRFGKLRVIGEAPGRDKDGKVCWRCICDCGNEAVTSTSQLLAGYKKSCGCLQRPPLKDWVGRQFGDLVVAAYDGKREGSHYWRCRCICGNETVVSQSNLKSGHTKSCGCRVDMEKIRHLVDGTCIESIRNRKRAVNNTSGVRGVYWNRRNGCWSAQITFQGKTRYLGSFGRLQEAAKARARAEEIFDDFLQAYDNSVNGGAG